MHPRSKHWHLIDYVIVRNRDRQDVRVTKAMCGAECWTDHRLLVSKLNLRIQPKRRPQGTKVNKRINISKLSDTSVRQSLTKTIEERLDSTPLNNQNVKTAWTSFRDLVYNTASDVLGAPTKKHKDWFDDNHPEIRELLDKKKRLHQAYLNDPNSASKKDAFTSIRSTIQRELRLMQDSASMAKQKGNSKTRGQPRYKKNSTMP